MIEGTDLMKVFRVQGLRLKGVGCDRSYDDSKLREAFVNTPLERCRARRYFD